MKKILIFISIVIVVGGIVLFSLSESKTNSNNDYLRIHVRANSNNQIDQQIKYIVKDEVVKFITPYAAECTDKQKAVKVISGILDKIEEECDKVLQKNGFNYKSKASIRQEKFPTRIYGDLTLEEGFYDALIVELGLGTGDNWWCVIYPPLCFTSGNGNVKYRSLILEIIKSFKKN